MEVLNFQSVCPDFNLGSGSAARAAALGWFQASGWRWGGSQACADRGDERWEEKAQSSLLGSHSWTRNGEELCRGMGLVLKPFVFSRGETETS